MWRLNKRMPEKHLVQSKGSMNINFIVIYDLLLLLLLLQILLGHYLSVVSWLWQAPSSMAPKVPPEICQCDSHRYLRPLTLGIYPWDAHPFAVWLIESMHQINWVLKLGVTLKKQQQKEQPASSPKLEISLRDCVPGGLRDFGLVPTLSSSLEAWERTFLLV